MTRNVQNAYTVSRWLSLPNVRVNVAARSVPQALDRDGREGGDARLGIKLPERDWRRLRERLVRLDLEQPAQVADWLTDAGYVPRLAWRVATVKEGDVPIQVPTQELHGRGFVNFYDGPTLTYPDGETFELCEVRDEGRWKPEHVAAGIVSWLQRSRDAIAWLMSLSQPRFRAATRAAHAFFEDQRSVQGMKARARFERRPTPAVSATRGFESALKTLRGKKGLDLKTLETFLMGAGRSPKLPALFEWDRDGQPSVTVHVNTPMEALILSVHADKNFSVRRLVWCQNCGQGFEQAKRVGAFCSSHCRNNYITNRRRRKVRLVRDGAEAWQQLSAGRRAKLDRAEWIAQWAEKTWRRETPKAKAIKIQPSWVQTTLAGLTRRTQ
jgi:hypothetical protein